MTKYLLLLLVFVGQMASAAVTSTPRAPESWILLRAGVPLAARHATLPLCEAERDRLTEAARAGANYECRDSRPSRTTWTADVVCPTAPAPVPTTINCPSGTVGSWVQTATTTIGAPPTCTATTVLSPLTAPAGACVTIPPAPASTQTVACPAGTTGTNWTQTRTVSRINVAPYWTTGAWTPTTAPATSCAPVTAQDWTQIAIEEGAFTVPTGSTVRYGANTTYAIRLLSGAGTCSNGFFGGDPLPNIAKTCSRWTGAGTPPPPNGGGTTPPPVEPPPTNPPPTGSAVTLYFSDCQAGATAGCTPGSNSNPGTEAAPKQNLSGLNVNTLGTGSRLLFKRGSSFSWPLMILDNPNATPTQPLVFDAYGTGARPIMTSSADAVFFGMYQNTSFDGGYTFRGLEFRGSGTGTGFFMQSVRYVTFDNMRITNFGIGIQSQADRAPGVHNVSIVNSDISLNRAMGILGQFSNTLIENNVFAGNNVRGSGFDHGTYLSGKENYSGYNITIRNNHYNRNSVLEGRCTGGNMTFHGQMDGVLIEGNRIEQDSAAEGCWLMSITQGYDTAEWFRNFVVRGNKLINGGNTGMAVQSAPGVIVENNVDINVQTVYHVGMNVGGGEFSNGDVPDGNATVRNNTGCYPNGGQNTVVGVRAPNSTATNNVNITGAAALTGVCAR